MKNYKNQVSIMYISITLGVVILGIICITINNEKVI